MLNRSGSRPTDLATMVASFDGTGWKTAILPILLRKTSRFRVRSTFVFRRNSRRGCIVFGGSATTMTRSRGTGTPVQVQSLICEAFVGHNVRP